MARKTYSQEFRLQAVQLYESTPGATFKGIAADLGISRGALAEWVRALGAAAGPGRPAPDTPPPGRPGSAPGRGGTTAAQVARLQAQVAALEAEKTKLATERDILRQAAKYFAGETNW